jgi:hypothetical protein
MLALPTTVAASSLGDRAVQCAAFNFGNWDYETANFSAEDRSDGWKDQAQAFAAVAQREGMSPGETSAYIKRHRSAMKALITAYVFSDDAKSEKTHEALSRQCAKIIRTEPEMAPYR